MRRVTSSSSCSTSSRSRPGSRVDATSRSWATVDSLELVQAAVPGATGEGASVQADVAPLERSLAGLARAASRHGGVEVSAVVAGSPGVDRARPPGRCPDRAWRGPEGSRRLGRRQGRSRAGRRGRARRRAARGHASGRLRLARRRRRPHRPCPRDSPWDVSVSVMSEGQTLGRVPHTHVLTEPDRQRSRRESRRSLRMRPPVWQAGQ